RPRKRSILTIRRSAGRASRPPLPEDRRELGGRNDLELIVATVGRSLVGTPAHEDGSMAEARALQVVVLHLARPLDAERLPGQILALAPAAGGAGHPGPASDGTGPFSPRVRGEGVLAQRFELLREAQSLRHRERRRHADVLERALVVVEPEKERADELAPALLVPAEPRHHAVGGAHVLDLDHHTLARCVDARLVLGDHPVEAGTLEAMEPLVRERADRKSVV